MNPSEIPDWVVYPGEQWPRLSPAAAGFDPQAFARLVAGAQVEGAAWEGEVHEGRDWGAVVTRGGYLVHGWGDPEYRYQTASVGKTFTRALIGLAVRRGLIDADEPIGHSWTGAGQLSHPHKYLDQGHHATLTWRHLIGRANDTSKHWGGFPVTNGFFWRRGARPDEKGNAIPPWAQWTGDPFYDNYAHVEPGTQGLYASGGIWRLSQGLTALWGRDLKAVLDDELFGHIGIRPERWDWLPGRAVWENKAFYPSMPGYGDFIDPPYEIGGQVVRGGGGWAVMAASDLARFGLLVATGGVWEGEQLLAPEWIHSHGGGNGSRLEGDSATLLSMGVVTTRGLPALRDFAALVTGPIGER